MQDTNSFTSGSAVIAKKAPPKYSTIFSTVAFLLSKSSNKQIHTCHELINCQASHYRQHSKSKFFYYYLHDFLLCSIALYRAIPRVLLVPETPKNGKLYS